MDIRIAFCWTGVSGYMAACWRALSAVPGVTIHVYARAASTAYGFDDHVMDGVKWTRLDDAAYSDAKVLSCALDEFRPNFTVVAGWGNPAYRRVVQLRSRYRGEKLIMTMDTPWLGSWRQRIGSILLKRFVANFDGALVAGPRAARYAERLGFNSDRISLGLYGFDDTNFWKVGTNRANRWPRTFLFVGRYVRSKGFDTLLAAYAHYAAQSSAPWQLICCGRGDLGQRLGGLEGIVDRGFVQPRDLWAVLGEAGCFIMPSTYEPWGVALAEACGAGLPIICSSAVGASDELVRDGLNGYVIPPNDIAALVQKMCLIERSHDHLAGMGRISNDLAREFTARRWAENILNFLRRMDRSGSTRLGRVGIR